MVTTKAQAPGLLRHLPRFIIPYLGLEKTRENEWLSRTSGLFAFIFSIGLVNLVIVGFELLAVSLNTLVSSGSVIASIAAWIGGLVFLFVACTTICFAWEVFAFLFGFVLGWKSGTTVALVSATLTLVGLNFFTPFTLAEGLRAMVQTWPPGQALFAALENSTDRSKGSSLGLMSFVLLPTMVKGCMLATLRTPTPYLGFLSIPATLYHSACLPFFGAKAHGVAQIVAKGGGFGAIFGVLGFWEIAYGTVLASVLGFIMYKAHEEYGHWAYLFAGLDDLEAPSSCGQSGLDVTASSLGRLSSGPALEVNLLGDNQNEDCEDNGYHENPAIPPTNFNGALSGDTGLKVMEMNAFQEPNACPAG